MYICIFIQEIIITIQWLMVDGWLLWIDELVKFVVPLWLITDLYCEIYNLLLLHTLIISDKHTLT